MIVCLDVDYRSDVVVCARLVIPTWDSRAALALAAFRTPGVAPPYIPGAFYKRELPYLVDALSREGAPPGAIVVVDGFVWLGAGVPGLGAHLREALPGKPPIVGVAKTPFRGAATVAREVRRGVSKTPLFVTAAGIGLDEAAEGVRVMHGPHRIPAMLRRVDRASREG